MDTEINTERLMIRRARPADIDALHALVSNFEVVRHTASWPWPPEREFTAMRAQPVDPSAGLAGPVLRAGEIIGMAGVRREDSDDGPVGDLGYSFAQAHWGQGYATEIGRALIDHCFARYDWARIEAGVFAGNPASARVLDKLGFALVGEDSHMCRAEGRERPLAVYHLSRAAWEAGNG